jgi:hypothetical protein
MGVKGKAFLLVYQWDILSGADAGKLGEEE